VQLVDDINKIHSPFTKAVITIGNFDGVHKGHQALLHKVRKKAKEIDGTAIAMTFEPHPLMVLKNGDHPPLITLYEQKVELLSREGLDVLIAVPFTLSFASITAHEFIQNILIKTIGMRAIVVGDDYSFGKNREGNVAFLKSHSSRYNYEVIIVDWKQISNSHGQRISSTLIREVVQSGQVESTPDLLGRYYQIRGKVVGGRNRGGKLLGFPTANIHLTDELCPKMGVYAVTVEINGEKHKGVANIGYSPTFDDHVFTVEVHVLDFDKNIYDRNIRVNFISRLRDEKKFSGISELSEQIEKDVAHAREILASIQ